MKYSFSDCGGCRTCEIACSYKHSGVFNHTLSAIEVIEKPDRTGYELRFVAEIEDSGRYICNGCTDVEGKEPLCMQYCHKSEDLREVIDQFMADSGQTDKTGGK